MGLTNEFERDLNAQAGLKRPGRIDLRVFQNTPDAGDGHPGLQRCFRNYLHESGMEKDLDLIGYSIKGTSVDITNAELQQLSNIGSSVITAGIWSQLDNIETTTISPAQWVFVGEADQAVKIADSPTFGGLSLTGNLVLAANSITGSSVNINNSELQQLSLIGTTIILGTQWAFLGNMDQDIITTSSPTFVGLTLSADVVTTSTFDSVDVSDLKDSFDTHKASSGIDHTYINQDLRTTFSPTFVGLTLSANLITTSTVDSVDIAGHDHSGANQGGTVAHSSTSGRTANDHHNQSHVLSGGDHTASGLTIGHVIRASGATTFVWAQLGHGDLSDIGSNAHSVIDSHLSDYDRHDNVQQTIYYLTGGFSLGGGDGFGANWWIACSDTSADIYATLHVTDPGTYRLHSISYCSANGGALDKAGGTVSIGHCSSGNVMSWNIANSQNWDMLCSQYQPRISDSEYPTNIIISNSESVLYVKWHKDDNMNGRTGNWFFMGFWLERTA